MRARLPILRVVAPLALLALAAPAALRAEAPREGLLAGQVLGTGGPLETVRVYAYHLAELNFRRATTDSRGRFHFERLPAGLYKIIALKTGFLPAVVMLTRTSSDLRQFLEVSLVEASAAAADGGEAPETDFWTIRRRIPRDVLRDLETPEWAADRRSSRPEPQRFNTEVAALSGVDQGLDYGEAQIHGGQLGLQGALGDMRIRLDGNFRALDTGAVHNPALRGTGQAAAITVDVQTSDSSRFRLTTLDNRLATGGDDLRGAVGFESHRLSWSGSVGGAGTTRLAAEYTSEDNYYRRGAVVDAALPASSSSWNVEGSYSTALNRRATLETGFRFRERRLGDLGLDETQPGEPLPEQRLDLFGRGGYEVEPGLLVEYGVYSTMRDGSLALAPRGGVVVGLGEGWKASTLASRRLQDDAQDLYRDFTPALYGEMGACEALEEYCYQVALSHEGELGESFSVAAVHRKFGDTMRLYFNEDFFNHLESLYIVPGDELPEVQFEITRRLAPSILTKLESSVGSGGGGILLTAGDGPFRNRIRYLVTSLDTRFEHTSTGVFLAFQHLEQGLDPIGGGPASGPGVEMDRLQIMLSQNFDDLLHLASSLAVRLNMEISRATGIQSSPYGDELLKRIIGGIAVKF